MARITTETVARAVGLLRAALADDPERFAPLAALVDDFPDGYDPDETPEGRDA